MYIAKGRIRYNGRLYEEGEEILFESSEDGAEKFIQELLDDGVIERGPDVEAAAAKAGESEGGGHARRVELVAACAALDPDAEDLWTIDGLPKVSALDIVGGEVSAAQRDEAWELYSAAHPAAEDGGEE